MGEEKPTKTYTEGESNPCRLLSHVEGKHDNRFTISVSIMQPKFGPFSHSFQYPSGISVRALPLGVTSARHQAVCYRNLALLFFYRDPSEMAIA
jgi:hypothetical protein